MAEEEKGRWTSGNIWNVNLRLIGELKEEEEEEEGGGGNDKREEEEEEE